MAEGQTAPAGSAGPPTLQSARRSRFLGSKYADVTKLRELAARHDRQAARLEQRAARLNTRIERLRHHAALLREKGQKVLGEIPDLDQEIKQHQRDVDAATARGGGGSLRSDVTALHYRIRKLQQKVVDRQQRARTLELHAATKTQRAAELEVKVSRLHESARLAEQEAAQYRQRADRLQLLTEQDASAGEPPGAGPATPPPSPPPTTGSPGDPS